WTQVVSPDIIGQAIDCYLFPTNPANYWYTTVNPEATFDAKLAGLGELVLILTGLFVLGAVLNGLAFFAMSWTGQHTLRDMRNDLFRHMQRLSMGFYGENES